MTEDKLCKNCNGMLQEVLDESRNKVIEEVLVVLHREWGRAEKIHENSDCPNCETSLVNGMVEVKKLLEGKSG